MSRRLIAEGLGTALLLFVVVGSGITAETLVADPGIGLFAHAISVGLGLAALIAMLQTVSGAHFNPAVSVAFWRTGEISAAETVRYMGAQILGAGLGVVTAHLSFGLEPITVGTTVRSGPGVVFSEAVATLVLVLVILGLVRTGRGAAVPAAVGAWVAAVVFATSSTGFANPAVTLARALTDTFTGIAPSSTPGFLLAQLAAGLLAAGVAVFVYPEQIRKPTLVLEE